MNIITVDTDVGKLEAIQHVVGEDKFSVRAGWLYNEEGDDLAPLLSNAYAALKEQAIAEESFHTEVLSAIKEVGINVIN